MKLRKAISEGLDMNESSLSRLWTHNEKHDCGAITAFRVAADCGNGKQYTIPKEVKKPKRIVSSLWT